MVNGALARERAAGCVCKEGAQMPREVIGAGTAPRKVIQTEMNSSNAAASAKTPARAWAVLAVTYLASIAAPMAQFKIPPLADSVIPQLIMSGIDPANVGTYFGLLMTCMTIIGAVLAFPAAFICKRFGLKGTVLASDACLAIGGFIAAIFGAGNLPLLYASRIIEGLGIGLIGVAAPTCVSIWFPERTRGRALGIWATWVPVGCVAMFLVAPYVSIALGYQSVFWATAIIATIAFVFKYPEVDNFGGDPNAQGQGENAMEMSFGQAMGLLKNKYIWLLGIVFFCFTFNTLGIVNTYYNTFMTLHGFDAALASNLTSIVTGCGIVTAPLAPMVMAQNAMGATMGMAMLQFMQNLGAGLGSVIYGSVIDVTDVATWALPGNLIQIPVCIIAIVCALLINPWKKGKKAAAAGEANTTAELAAEGAGK